MSFLKNIFSYKKNINGNILRRSDKMNALYNIQGSLKVEVAIDNYVKIVDFFA